jgi:hypothetical protein
MKRVIRSDKPVTLLLLLWSHKCDFGAEPRSRIIATSAVKGLTCYNLESNTTILHCVYKMYQGNVESTYKCSRQFTLEQSEHLTERKIIILFCFDDGCCFNKLTNRLPFCRTATLHLLLVITDNWDPERSLPRCCRGACSHPAE